jgi:hypothetical protein
MVAYQTTEHGKVTIIINVDQRYPTRWREEPYYGDIRELALKGLKQTNDDRFTIRVVVGTRSWLILPHREVELTGDDCGVFVQLGADEFEWIRLGSKTEFERLLALAGGQ